VSLPAAEGRGVTYSYGDRQALCGIDFAVAPGSVHGFLGPNGSGKSTLFKLLSTIVAPQAGSLHLLGCDLVTQQHLVRQRIGVVFQSPAVDKKLTVRENLRYGGHLYGLRGGALEQRIDELLRHAGLADRAGEKLAKLSGGMRRRVEVAKCMLHRPELLLLDEASTGLDPAARRDMWSLLRSQQGLTVLFTTHLMEEAAQADHLTLLDQGRIVAEGRPVDLVRSVGGEVLEIEADEPDSLAAELRSRHGIAATVVDRRIHVRAPSVHAMVGKVMETHGARIRRLTVAQPSLEDVFLQVTGKRFESVNGGAA
jgi:ABC-2 type transport system ATP-binding protein